MIIDDAIIVLDDLQIETVLGFSATATQRLDNKANKK